MNFRMPLGGGKQDNQPYTEGYNAGYNSAVEEMRRRTRSADDYNATEARRRAEADIHWPIEARRMGYVGEPQQTDHHDDMRMMMNMLHEVKEGQEQLKRGMTSAVKKLDPHMEALLETATTVLDAPPSTWEPYVKRQDYFGIAKMEGKELLTALEEHKPVKDIRKELSHTLAALLQLAAAH